MTGDYKSNGARLGYADSGTGAPVVFLHPTPLDGDFWRPLTSQLPGIRAIVPDLRAHGQSELGSNLPVGEFTRVPDAPSIPMRLYAADILSLLDHLNVTRAIFVGCSIGGYVLLELWRQAPERMSALCFLCSKPQPDAEANLVKRAATIAQTRAGESATIYDGMAQSLIGPTARKSRPGIIPELRSRMTLTAEALIAVQAGLATRPDSIPTVASFTAPVLAIAGSEDPVCTPAEMESFRAAPGGCEYHIIPNAGHFAAYEQPGAVASILQDWSKNLTMPS